MRFGLSPDQKLLQSATIDFLEARSPIGAVRSLHEASSSIDRDVWHSGAELGWTSLLVPEQSGGGSVSGEGLIDATIIAEELGRRAAAGPFAMTNVVAAALAEASNADKHAQTLERLMSGDAIGTWACRGPVGGWNPQATAVDAVRQGDGYRLNGAHDQVEMGAQADVVLVLARTGAGLSQFLVSADTSGLIIRPHHSLDLVRSFARIDYHDVDVPASALVGQEGAAAEPVERQFQIAVVLQCAEIVGAMQKVLEITAQWMADRYSFGRPLASYQALKHRYADMVLQCESAQATMAGAARAVQDSSPDAAKLVSVAKAWIGPAATDLMQDCVQLHGGLGVTWEHDLHIYLRRATVDRVTWGTPSEHRRRIADALIA